MNTDSKVVRLRQPDEIDDALTEVLRSGARRLLAQAIELEAEAFLADMRDLRLPDGRARLVRHGHGPERVIQARMEDHAECMLVLIGATPEGKKELVGFQVGVRESAQSW